MVSALWYTVLIGAFMVERLVEVNLSLRHARIAFSRGGVEHGRGHYPLMVVVHTAFLFACPLEVWLLDRPFVPLLGWSMLGICLFTQLLRWWVIGTLGWRWNTRVIVVPGLEPVSGGPFRWIKHPNYLAVILELAALPLVHSAWITAVLFTVLNAVVLSIRIPVEDRALGRGSGR